MPTQSPKRHIKKLAEYSPDEYDIWFLDEVFFQQQGSRCRMWIPPEIKQPVVMQEPGRKSAGYFGAVRLRDGKFIFSREENVFNADSTWNFLKKLQQIACAGKKRSSLESTTLDIIMRKCIKNGAKRAVATLFWNICLLTVPN